MPLKTRLGQTLCQGSWRVRFQPLTTSKPCVELVEEAGDLGGVVLEVGVEGEDDVASGGLEAGGEGGGLAEVAAEADGADAGVGGGEPADGGPGAVAAAVVDEEELEGALAQWTWSAASASWAWSSARLCSSL